MYTDIFEVQIVNLEDLEAKTHGYERQCRPSEHGSRRQTSRDFVGASRSEFEQIIKALKASLFC